MSFDPARLRQHYRAFLKDPRVLLTGHSHQAWPDVARDALARSFEDAAAYVDDKWGRAVFPLMERVGRRVLGRLGFAEDDAITFASNTHELVYRLLSALPSDARVLTTTGEFHSMHRQLSRCAEDGLRVTWIEGAPRSTLAERLLESIQRGGADLVALSAVFFEDAFILPRLTEIAEAADRAGMLVLVDAYHAFNVVPLALPPSVFVVAGGYKYAQYGEGVCFLRSPSGSELRPRYTGWFADFGSLESPRVAGKPTAYGAGGARFAGSTFDPSSLYRADAVLELHDQLGLDVPTLRSISTAQTSRIVDALSNAGLNVVSSSDPARRAGFVATKVKDAHRVVEQLRQENVFADARGDMLRLGPAPYLLDEEIDRGVQAVLRLASPD